MWRYHSIVCCIVYSWWPINLILTWQVSCRNWWSQLLCSMPMVLLTLATKAEDIKFSLSFIAMLSSLPHAGHIYTLYVNYARITIVIIGTSLSLLSPIFSIIVVLYIRRYIFRTAYIIFAVNDHHCRWHPSFLNTADTWFFHITT